MADTKEKLAVLVEQSEKAYSQFVHETSYMPNKSGFIADHLIANGVAVLDKDESKISSKWIPVSERLPDLILCDAGTAYSEAVNVLTTGRKVLTAIWDGFDWICDAEFWDAEGEEITHWTPVPLPLPEPPKGEKEW